MARGSARLAAVAGMVGDGGGQAARAGASVGVCAPGWLLCEAFLASDLKTSLLTALRSSSAGCRRTLLAGLGILGLLLLEGGLAAEGLVTAGELCAWRVSESELAEGED